MTKGITMRINGQPYTYTGASDTKLLQVLREELHLLGAKDACGQGHCGACTVLIDGRAKKACLASMGDLNQANIETVEGLSREGIPHPLQTAFAREGAVQCGFCTPGMLMASKALLDQNPSPTEKEIQKALQGNLCRCTGYAAIIRAVKWAAVQLASSKDKVEAKEETQGLQGVGTSPIRKDAWEKVAGKGIFADDHSFSGMLFGRVLLSEQTHARIKSIRLDKAAVLAGVVKIVTAADLPGRNGFGILEPHQPVFARDVVRYPGEVIAVVFAQTKDQAQAAVRAIEVDYEPLKAVLTPEEAVDINAPKLHPGGNILKTYRIRKGSTEKAFAQAHMIVEGRYTTPRVEHAYLETESALAFLDENQILTVWTASQGSQTYQRMIAASLALPEDRVRVVYTPAGGAFGGKEEPSIQIHCALGAYLTGRPVKITLTRRESLLMSTKRHPMTMHYRHGADKDGRIIAVEVDITADAGAYASLSASVLLRAAAFSTGPYAIPNATVHARAIYTNQPPSGAFRGFGSTQVAFAVEQQMDRMARALGMDPLELRKRNGLREGKDTVTGQRIKSDCGYLQTIEAVEQRLADALAAIEEPAPGKRIGVGVASAYKNVGFAGGSVDRAGAILELDSLGRIWLKIGAADLGQGSDTTLVQIAAQATGIHYGDIQVLSNDTAHTPDGGVTTASRQTYISGHAVLGAGKAFIEKVQGLLTAALGIGSADYEVVAGGIQLNKKGKYSDRVENNFVSYQNLAELATDYGIRIAAEYTYRAPVTYPLRERTDHQAKTSLDRYNLHYAYCYSTQAAIVEVDVNTGEVKVCKLIAAQDLGRAIHPQNCVGQIEGAMTMGVGFALSETFTVEQAGKAWTDSLAKLKLPRILQSPEMEIVLIEKESEGPFGAKGMAEIPMNATAPAIINGIFDAVGVRISDLPAEAKQILDAMRQV